MQLYVVEQGSDCAEMDEYNTLTVHSSFEHSCNVILNEDKGLFAFLSSELEEMHPFALRVQHPQNFSFKAYLESGDKLHRLSDKVLQAGNNLKIIFPSDLKTWDEALIEASSYQPYEVHLVEESIVESILNKNARTELMNAFLQVFNYFSISHAGTNKISSFNTKLYEHFCNLLRGMYAHYGESDPSTWLKFLSKMIGLGKGLTPSGDDFLVGFLSGMWSTQSEYVEELILEIRTTINTYLEDVHATNKISRTFIEHALRGQFSKRIVNVLRSIESNDIQAQVFQLSQWGGSSGFDLMIGLASFVMCESKRSSSEIRV